MDQPRLGGKMNRRRFLKTAAGTTAGAALTAWSLKHASPAVVPAAVLRNRLRFILPPRRGWSMSRALLLEWRAATVREWRRGRQPVWPCYARPVVRETDRSE